MLHIVTVKAEATVVASLLKPAILVCVGCSQVSHLLILAISNQYLSHERFPPPHEVYRKLPLPSVCLTQLFTRAVKQAL